jgi:hypothetical protein
LPRNGTSVKTFSKEELIAELKKISAMGWVDSSRSGNNGNVGNTLEDLLGIQENNLPIPNASEWELKTQRMNTTALTTMFHTEPSPRAIKFVPHVLLQLYGWKHQKAGSQYPANEKSFRQTINGLSASDRGFIVKINRQERKVLVSFDSSQVSKKHKNWLNSVSKNVGLGELNPQPYWGFDDLANKAGTKLINCFFIQADSKIENGIEHFHYKKIMMLKKFSFDKFLEQIEKGNILIDFDARTGHNHGTKFRMRQNCLQFLYEEAKEII